MNYAQGKGWTIDVGRSPYSGGYTVELERDGKITILGNKFGYARSETAERRASREAQRLWDKETQ